jgi:hypothetical protein
MGISWGRWPGPAARGDINPSAKRKNADLTRISAQPKANLNLVFTLNLKTPARPKSCAFCRGL